MRPYSEATYLEALDLDDPSLCSELEETSTIWTRCELSLSSHRSADSQIAEAAVRRHESTMQQLQRCAPNARAALTILLRESDSGLSKKLQSGLTGSARLKDGTARKS